MRRTAYRYRLTIAFIALCIAGATGLYVVQHRADTKLRAYQLKKCRTDNSVRTNQRLVLDSLVELIGVLDDRTKADLAVIPPEIAARLRKRLTPLHAPYPDTNCDGIPDPPTKR